MPDSYDEISAGAGPAEDPNEEFEAPEPATPDRLQSEADAAREESEFWHDRFLRKAAELENYRKRVDREKRESVLLARSDVILEFLPIVDACQRALNSFEDLPDDRQGMEQYKQGVELLYRQFHSTLARMGVVPIDAIGQEFDPHLHEALTRLETTEHDDNRVIAELRRGYMMEDRLLRPAQVVVAAPPVDGKGAER